MPKNFQDWLNSGGLTSSLIIIGCAIVAWMVIKRAFNQIINYTENRDGKRNGSVRTAKRLVKYGIIVVVVLALFQVNGINVTSLIASLGITGAVIGFAAQEYLKDFFMGVHISSDTFFKVGDVIKFRDHIGVVTAFTMKTTKIKDIYTRNIISISNRNLDVVEVMSNMVDLRIGLSYNEDPERIHAVMKELAKKLPERVEGVEDSIYKGTSEFNDSTVNYMISVFMDPEKVPQLQRNVLMEIQREFASEGIEFPFPQLDVHVDGYTEASSGSAEGKNKNTEDNYRNTKDNHGNTKEKNENTKDNNENTRNNYKNI